MTTTDQGGHKARPNGTRPTKRPRKRMTRSSVGGVKLATVKPNTNRNNAALEAGHWFETKTISGHQYNYECWREGGRKRSKYKGKAKPV